MIKLTIVRNRINCDAYRVWVGEEDEGLMLGIVLVAIDGNSVCFRLMLSHGLTSRPNFNTPLTGYTSLRAAILALAHACDYPDAELPEGWTP